MSGTYTPADKTRRQLRVRLLGLYKLLMGCAVCGFQENSVALDFHHREPETKLFNFNDGGSLGNRSWRAIEVEVQKCIVLCANHHRMVSHRMMKL